MTVQAIGSNSGFGGAANAQSSSDTYKNEIKLLQDQKTNIQKQINDVKTGKQSQELKDQQVKILQQQLAEIDAEIQQKQIEQAKDKASDRTQKSGGAQAQTGDRDRVEISGQAVQSQLLLSDIYDKAGKLDAMTKAAKGKAAALKSDAKMAGDNGNAKVAATLSTESGSLSAAADSEASQAAHEASKVTKGEHTDKTQNGTSAVNKRKKKSGSSRLDASSVPDTPAGEKQADDTDSDSVQ